MPPPSNIAYESLASRRLMSSTLRRPTTTMSLTPEQARALWDAGGFALIQGLPRGSEVGMDGT